MGEAIELKTPADVLRRVLERLSRRAEIKKQNEKRERTAVEESEAESALVDETCGTLLAALDAA